jgi:hypothetical protein
MTRLELGLDRTPLRMTVFSDLGWVGDRRRFTNLVRPMSEVGLGLSLLDGMVRLDVARGFHPREQTRFSAYLAARF